MGRAISALVALTPGDPAGVGPEVMLAAWRAGGFDARVRLCGDVAVWARAADVCGVDRNRLAGVAIGSKTVDRSILPEPGMPTEAGARIAWQALDQAIDGCLAGEYGAIVTGPVAKLALQRVGFPATGHTDYLKARFDVENVLMVMYAPGFCVGLATDHIPLAAVPAALSAARLEWQCRALAGFLRQANIANPRIAVAGLNPHAGEGGLLGLEDRIVAEAVSKVPDATGPLPGDTVFLAMAEGRFDGVLAMYHDQGLAPFKLRHFHDGVNVTVGLPVLRSSPDHGTAFDVAATGRRPDTRSATAALNLALRRLAVSASLDTVRSSDTV